MQILKKKLKKINNKLFFSILPNPTVITSNVTRSYAGNYADFALQVIFEPYLQLLPSHFRILRQVSLQLI